jgi:hypothetical protein
MPLVAEVVAITTKIKVSAGLVDQMELVGMVAVAAKLEKMADIIPEVVAVPLVI